MNISIKKVVMKADNSTALKLESPYHPDLPKKLRALGGTWHDGAKAWYFPTDLEKNLRDLCVEFYGLDPLAEVPAESVVLRIESPHYIEESTWWQFGRQILRRASRDSSVQPGEGVSIIEGGFSAAGGSRNNPTIGYANDNTILLVRNVPKAMADKFIAENPKLDVIVVE